MEINMDLKKMTRLVLPALVSFIAVSFSSLLNAAEQNKTQTINLFPSSAGPLVLNADAPENSIKKATADEGGEPPAIVKWHNMLGWGTLGMTVITMASGAAFPHKGHCGLSGVTTGLATATCITGFFLPKEASNLPHGKLKSHIHALLGTLATIGLISTLAIVDENGNKSHVAVGAASGAALAVSLGVFYF
jgi:hypothetical protein